MSNEKDWFDKAESIAKVGSLILLPIIILFLTNSYTSNENEKARRAEYIKISINILQEKPEKEKEDVRAWAVNVINKYSDVKFEEKAKEQLIKESIFGLNYYYSFISDNKVNYSFSWIGDAKKIYNFELQKYVKGEWVSEVGFCIVGNSFNYPIDIKDKIRWRVYEGYDMPENTPWRDLVFYHN